MRYPRRAHRAKHCSKQYPRSLVGARRAYTLTELVVSLLLLTVGVLAMASTASVLTFQASASASAERAAAIGQARLEALRAAGCGAATDGSATHGPIAERWTVTQARGAVTTAVEVTFPQRADVRSQRYEGGFPC